MNAAGKLMPFFAFVSSPDRVPVSVSVSVWDGLLGRAASWRLTHSFMRASAPPVTSRNHYACAACSHHRQSNPAAFVCQTHTHALLSSCCNGLYWGFLLACADGGFACVQWCNGARERICRSMLLRRFVLFLCACLRDS